MDRRFIEAPVIFQKGIELLEQANKGPIDATEFVVACVEFAWDSMSPEQQERFHAWRR